MKKKERQIISHLRQNAKVSLAKISQETEIPVSTVHDKINRLEKEGVIKKHTTLVDYQKLGYHHHHNILLNINRSQKKEFLLFLLKHQAVNSIQEVNEGHRFLIETVHQNIKEYLAFIDGLQEMFDVSDIQEYLVIDEVKKEGFKIN